MSNVKYAQNSRESSIQNNYQAVPGNTLQQMWHVLTFHEKRFKLLNQTINDLSKQNGALLQRITVLENAASEPKISEIKKKSLKQQVQLEISE